MKPARKQPWNWWGMKLERFCARSDCPRVFDEKLAMELHSRGLSILEAYDQMPVKASAVRAAIAASLITSER